MAVKDNSLLLTYRCNPAAHHARRAARRSANTPRSDASKAQMGPSRGTINGAACKNAINIEILMQKRDDADAQV